MGKTLAKQRKKAAKAQQSGAVAAGGALAAIAKRLKHKLPSGGKRVKLVPLISDAFSAKAWHDAHALLSMLQEQQESAATTAAAAAAAAAAARARAATAAPQYGTQQQHAPHAHHPEVPKLGAVMRWVRAADLAGTEAIAAQLLASILRVAAGPPPSAQQQRQWQQQQQQQQQPSGSPTAAERAAAAGDSSGGSGVQDVVPVRRFPPWLPPPSAAAAAATAAAAAAAGGNATGAQQDAPADAAAGTGTAAAAAAGGASPSTSTTAAAASSAASPSAFSAAGAAAAAVAAPVAASASPYAGRFAVVPLPPEYAGTNANGSTATTAAAAVLPNIVRDLTMFCTEPGLIRFDPAWPPAARVEVPFVPGAFVLVGALSAAECAQICECAETMGYTVDPDYSFSAAARAAASGGGLGGLSSSSSASAARNGGSGGGERGAAGCVWLADESLQGPLYGRIAHLLPQRLCGGDLAGINARWRLYRYDKGAVYRPHVDGAWPGSGLVDGKYEFDAYGDRWSRLTFLVYLNDGFEGGATTFYTPARPGSGSCLEAHSVRPVAGNILVFPHGDTQGSLVHEGAAVTAGSKYVIRTEVLYKLAHGVKANGAGAPQPAMQLPAAKRG